MCYPCVRGRSQLCLYKKLDLPVPSTRFYVCLMSLESYPHNLFQVPTLSNVRSLLENIKVSDQFYKSFILGLLFTQGCESETYDVVDSIPKECRKMRCKSFSSMHPTYGMEKRFNFFSTKTPNSQMQFAK
jgi:hypothetical protein